MRTFPRGYRNRTPANNRLVQENNQKYSPDSTLSPEDHSNLNF